MGLLLEIDKPEVQQNCLVVGADFERPAVDGDGLIGTAGTGIDHAEIAKRGDMIRLFAENRLEPAFGTLVIPCRERPRGIVENLLRRLGGTEKKGAQAQTRTVPHLVQF